MNLVQSTVKKVIGKPYFNHLWCVNVEADCWGHTSKQTVTVKTEEEAKLVKPGYKFMS